MVVTTAFKNEASAILLFRLRGVKRMRKIKPIDSMKLNDRFIQFRLDEKTSVMKSGDPLPLGGDTGGGLGAI